MGLLRSGGLGPDRDIGHNGVGATHAQLVLDEIDEAHSCVPLWFILTSRQTEDERVNPDESGLTDALSIGWRAQSVAKRFSHMEAGDAVIPRQIGQRPRNAEYPCVTPRR